MRFRKLRIAFSATCLIACVLLIALWVRGYWKTDVLGMKFGRCLYELWSEGGELWFYGKPYYGEDISWYYNSMPIYATEFLPPPNVLGFRVGDISLLPYWFLTLLPAALAAVPWIRRFSLRTLLIVTTLVAVGLAAYAASK